MITFEELINIPPFGLNQPEKNDLFIKNLTALTEHHKKNCSEYKKIVDGIYHNQEINNLEDIPFIPVRLFKELDLKSISDDDIFKVLTSSGTSGQRVSKIYVDKSVTEKQRKTLLPKR